MEFNPEKHYLGKLCKRGHEWQDTGKTLRRIDNRNCPECVKILSKSPSRREKKNENHRKNYHKNREVVLQKRRAYYQENRERIRAREKELYDKTREKRNAYSRAYKSTEKYRQQRKDRDKRNAKRLEEHRKRYRRNNKERIDKYNKKYREENREVVRERSRRYAKKNKVKYQEYARKHRAENRELYREKKRRRRAKIKEVSLVDFKPSEIKTRFLEFDNSCAYCGSEDRITADHFIPINKGGGHCIGNIVPACLSCNSGKCDRDPQEWYEQQSFYSKKQWQKILNILGKKNPNQLPLF